MNPLQEYPHLFANGKFTVDWHNEKQFQLIGFTNEDGRKLRIKTDAITKSWCFVDGCTLIARPISDMTDEEIAEVLETDCYSSEYARELLIDKANKDTLLGYHERNMADLGVYFGLQSHFDDGTVIDITTL